MSAYGAAVAIGAVLATAAFAASAPAEHNLLEQVSTGPSGGNGDIDVHFSAASADGAHVFFDDERGAGECRQRHAFDVYERSGGQTTLVSTGPAGGNGAFTATFVRRVGRRDARLLRDCRSRW